MDKTREMLEEAIETELLNMKKLTTTDEDKAKAVENLTKLYDLKIKEAGTEGKSERAKNQIFKIVIDLVGIVLPLMGYAFWMRKGFQFEENGTYTSHTFKGLINRFKPTK